MRCIAADGSMLGVLATRDALDMARRDNLDLVEISPNADPPVCRIMDFGKFQYEENRKRKQAKKHQHSHAVKEIKFHANTDEHDYRTKITHVREFIEKGHKVKLTLTFRGRENAHKELGFDLLNRAIKECDDVSVLDQSPKRLGRSIIALIGPKPVRQGGAQKASGGAPSQPRPAVPVVRPPAPAPVDQVVPAAAPQTPQSVGDGHVVEPV